MQNIKEEEQGEEKKCTSGEFDQYRCVQPPRLPTAEAVAAREGGREGGALAAAFEGHIHPPFPMRHPPHPHQAPAAVSRDKDSELSGGGGTVRFRLPDGLQPNIKIVGAWPFGIEGLWLCYATLQSLKFYPFLSMDSPGFSQQKLYMIDIMEMEAMLMWGHACDMREVKKVVQKRLFPTTDLFLYDMHLEIFRG